MNTSSANGRGEAVTLTIIRGFLLVIFLIGLLGTGAELLLVKHTEDYWQLAPLLLMALSLVVLGWRAVARGRVSMRIFQATMLLFVLSGFAGLWLHYQANTEFELEMYPSLQGLELFWKAIQGASPPSLAPGVMIQLGLLGLAYTYRHPALAADAGKKVDLKGEIS
jgi:hypothetical protein